MKAITQLIHHIAHQLSKSTYDIGMPIDKATQEAWWIIEHLCNKKKTELLLEDPFILNDTQKKKLNAIITERTVYHKPLQYILENTPFCGLSIISKPPILIPRPETEEWCTWLIEHIKSVNQNKTALTILDLCSGSGCIALALAFHLPYTKVIACDILPEAITLAEENKQALKIENVQFIQSDLFEAFTKNGYLFDLIVANPPYISPQEKIYMSPEVTQWEDPKALFAPDAGLAIIKQIAIESVTFISKHIRVPKLPQLVMEIGYTQGPIVSKILLKAGWKSIGVHKDLERKDRWITAHIS